MRKFKDIDLAFVADGPGKQCITDEYGTVGTVTDNQVKGKHHYSYEGHKLQHRIQATGSDKKKEQRHKNRIDQDFIVYHIDDDGNYAPKDLVMAQGASSYYNEKYECNVNMFLQVFTTECAYVTKDELKQRKKDNKMKMTFQDMLDFERAHKIPLSLPTCRSASMRL